MSTLSERLKAFNQDLIPAMVQLKYAHMAESAFRFFRGTCHLFYEDLSKVKNFPVSPATWICGDLHLENFGSFKGNNRMVYFDLNDFDESVLAPAAWEVVRVLTSIFVAFDSLKIDHSEALKAAKLFIAIYSNTLTGGKAYYIDPRVSEGIVKSFLRSIEKRKEADLIKKIAEAKGDQLKIKLNKSTHFKVDDKLKAELTSHLNEWLKGRKDWPVGYVVRDVAFRVAGTGSIGLKRYMFLVQNKKNKKKFALIEMKEAAVSSLAPYNPVKQPVWDSQAERIVTIKQRMQSISPALLSPNVFKEDKYVLQEMQPMADKINFESIAADNKCLELVIKDMAMLTASAQIRSGGIQHSAIIDELTAFGKDKKWHQPLLDYAVNYAIKVNSDYAQYMSDYKKGLFY